MANLLFSNFMRVSCMRKYLPCRVVWMLKEIDKLPKILQRCKKPTFQTWFSILMFQCSRRHTSESPSSCLCKSTPWNYSNSQQEDTFCWITLLITMNDHPRIVLHCFILCTIEHIKTWHSVVFFTIYWAFSKLGKNFPDK